MRFPVAVAVLGLLLARPAAAAPCAELAEPTRPATMKDFVKRLDERIVSCAGEARAPDAKAFWEKHRLEATPARTKDYVVMRTLFELTRDGGPFRVRWAVTNREPTAKDIWKAWAAAPPLLRSDAASATAECDELSALQAGLARRLGVRNVGLFWPTWNHTITAWEPAPNVRVLVPTSQIFQACGATFDGTTFDPTGQKTVFEISAVDVPDAFVVPPALEGFLLGQVTHYGGASLDLLAALRIHRALRHGSSVPSACAADVTSAAAALRSRSLSAEDTRALVRYGTTELMLVSPSAADVLARLGSAS